MKLTKINESWKRKYNHEKKPAKKSAKKHKPILELLEFIAWIVKQFHAILVLHLLVTVILSVTGCSKPPPKHTDSVILKDDVQLAADKEYVREPFNDQTRLGVIKQRTLYEMHFKPDSAKLSNLGKRDVAILAEAMRDDGGRISLPRATASDTLHAARIEQVRATLVEAGIDLTRVKIGDESTGGAGINTIDALLIRENIRKSPMKESGGKILNDAGDGKSSGGNP